MFDPIEIHGAEDSEYFTRIYWDEAEGLIGMEYVHVETGEKDGEMLFVPAEVQALGWALLTVYGYTFDVDGKPKIPLRPVQAEVAVYPRQGGKTTQALAWEAVAAIRAQRVPFDL